MTDSGVLLIDKPVGITSFDVIRQLRKITRIRRMGHTGTLDPFASGLLIICIGKATRLSAKIINQNKQYSAVMQLGIKTDTGDSTGNKVSEKDFAEVKVNQIKKLVPEILKISEQIPHRYSALKVNGKKAYELARNNQDPELQPRQISILNFRFAKIELPRITYVATVSKGTYIRVLSETIGEMLNNYGSTVELRRTAIGKIKVEKAEKLASLNPENWRDKLFPLINIFSEFPQIEISEKEREDFRQGRKLGVDFPDVKDLLITCDNSVLGFGEVEEKILRPRTVIV
ncbi:MAG: hypothetical protein APR54_07040 [Candidatus Cloacimonas sp. SDB]|nr:MAG: hypothetical protein APR54_07040 [Candidatus Cloacimonas sp. SDB]